MAWWALQAAHKQLVAECGEKMDTWIVSRKPIGVYKPSQSDPNALEVCVCVCVIHLQTRDLICVPHKHVVFFYKAHIMAGQVTPTQGIEDFAWLTKQEIKQQVDETYWENTKDMLSDF